MSFLAPYVQLLHREMEHYALPAKPEALYDPIRYFLQLGGKRLRPILVLMGYSLLKEDREQALPIARMVELFHNFSLVHDDIMDGAPLRRGMPTVHEKWNTNIGILSGDMILIKAYQELEQVPPLQAAALLNVFNTCAIKVCEGQQHDMDFETRSNVTVEEYLEMIYLKTSALVEHSLEMGAMLAGANEEQREHIRAFGKNLGIAFQLRDDLLDVFGEADFGKRKAGDIITNKKTFLLLKALEKASSEQRAQLDHWLGLSMFDEDQKVAEVTSIFRQLGIYEDTEAIIAQYTERADSALRKLQEVRPSVLEELHGLQDYLMNRTT